MQLRIEGTFVIVLDVSFRVDIRLCCTWEHSSKVDPDSVSTWARGRFMRRFLVGTMVLEGSGPSIFLCLVFSDLHLSGGSNGSQKLTIM